MNIEIELAAQRLRLALRLPETAVFFENFITARDCPDYDVSVPDEDLPLCREITADGSLTPYAEYFLFISRISQFLLKYARVVIHGVAFLWRGRAWLITAPSGVGKTTQLRHWQRLWPDEIQIISGDKPVLELKADGSFWLHPSPWPGKEGCRGTACGKLGGIVLLEQADYNAIRRLPPQESVLRVFQQLLVNCDTEEDVYLSTEITDRLLSLVPVWNLENLGNEASARLTHDALEEYEAMQDESI